jgi:hypothetical protein
MTNLVFIKQMGIFNMFKENKKPLYTKGFGWLCMVETSGIEPLTFWLPAKRSPS